ncbi:cytochrome c [Tropicibacter sp. R15_0]|uniref:c-type cytochrome n=1 Tax=Tropicibacter sp. R15_0 TaxID=2821101 RepID=UPI001ADADC15|nr:cytochrome c [Tropicibacter sp. R15_0]MBO9467184.1 cytochrome c [Tropicibacter sp. R15_0]
MKYLFWSIPLTVVAAAFTFSLSTSANSDVGSASKVDSYDIKKGALLYAENCASCHGADLEGQPDWQTPGADGRLPAPPHDETGHTWHHPDSLLFDYTKLGGEALLARQGVEYDSGMPGFGNVLTDQEIHNILAFIRSTWPDRIREVQAARTDADRQRGDN